MIKKIFAFFGVVVLIALFVLLYQHKGISSQKIHSETEAKQIIAFLEKSELYKKIPGYYAIRLNNHQVMLYIYDGEKPSIGHSIEVIETKHTKHTTTFIFKNTIDSSHRKSGNTLSYPRFVGVFDAKETIIVKEKDKKKLNKIYVNEFLVSFLSK